MKQEFKDRIDEMIEEGFDVQAFAAKIYFAAERGRVVQITDSDHALYGALAVVEKPTRWGAEVYMVIPKDGAAGVSLKHITLDLSAYENIGHALLNLTPLADGVGRGLSDPKPVKK